MFPIDWLKLTPKEKKKFIKAMMIINRYSKKKFKSPDNREVEK